MPATSRWPFPRHAISAVRRASIVAEFGDAAPAVRPSWRMAASDGGRARLYVYDIIGGWDSDAGEFVQAVHGIAEDVPGIDLHINSPGGFVFDAVSMFEALDAHPAPVAVHIDGLAASAASFLAMVGATVEIARTGRILIHDAQMVAVGPPSALREAADLGDAISDDIAGYYAARAGGKPAEWRTAMQAETTYSAQQAVDAGLADSIARRADDNDDDAGAENLASQLIRARARVTLGGVK